MAKVYSGSGDSARIEYHVVVRDDLDDKLTLRSLPLRLDLRNHSPTGFSWGYHGSGPAQLALALLADATGLDDQALSHYQQFKHEVVSRWPAEWTITAKEINDWLCQKLEEGTD